MLCIYYFLIKRKELLGRPSNITFIVLIYQFYIKVCVKTAERWGYKTWSLK